VHPGPRPPARRRAISLVVTTSAAEPSFSGLELPAVTDQSSSPKRRAHRSSANAGRSPASVSTVVPGRIVSSVSSSAVFSGAICAAKWPSFQARAARWWLVAANSSRRASRRAESPGSAPCPGPDGRVRRDQPPAGRAGLEGRPLRRADRAAETAELDTDETIRPGTTVETLAGLRPAFADDRWARRFGELDWSVTAGNSSR